MARFPPHPAEDRQPASASRKRFQDLFVEQHAPGPVTVSGDTSVAIVSHNARRARETVAPARTPSVTAITRASIHADTHPNTASVPAETAAHNRDHKVDTPDARAHTRAPPAHARIQPSPRPSSPASKLISPFSYVTRFSFLK